MLVVILQYNFEMSRNEVDSDEIHEYIKEYLKYWDLNNSLESLEEELKSKVSLLSHSGK